MVVDVELTQNITCNVLLLSLHVDRTAPTGAQDLRAPDDRMYRPLHPSIVETLPDDFPDLKHEFSRLESQMFDRPKRPGLVPLTPVLPDANDRILTPGFNYNPVHTEIYGTYRNNAKRAL